MLIKQVEIENYKCFFKRQVVPLQEGFNLLMGANNSGKSSVLDVLDLDFNLSRPHRSVASIPARGDQTTRSSSFAIACATSLRELASTTRQAYRVPVGTGQLGPQELRMMATQYPSGREPIDVTFKFEGSNSLTVDVRSSGAVKGEIQVRPASSKNLLSAVAQVDPSRVTFVEPAMASPDGLSVPFVSLRERIYRFSASRRPQAVGGPVRSLVLDRDAEYLPYCLNWLQTSDAAGHELLCAWVEQIFPSVRWVQSTPNPDGRFSIACLPLKPKDRRDDLAVSLSEMGSGIGNVIAMLYVVLTARDPQVIAIDEPNAFLHPRALRELLAILQSEGSRHQYILTGHSPDVLTAIDASAISVLALEESQAVVRTVQRTELHLIQADLAELGISVTDLHGKDRVLWVEGETEELVMPALLRFACPEVAAGTAVLRVEKTGAFAAKRMKPEEVASIYKRLSTSSALVPPMTCILLDAEGVPEATREQRTRDSHGALQFLGRRMLENYLLSPAAIAAALCELGTSTERDAVASTMKNHASFDPATSDISQADGAKILKSAFEILSNATQEFRKTRDVPAVVEWLLVNDPDFLQPLALRLRAIFKLDAMSE
jgi:energy-coupling factor transporter ATP-binding protein EcfA2